MNEPITEKTYPITVLWVFKLPIILVVVSLVALFFGIWLPYLVLILPILLIVNPLARKVFHYTLSEKFFVVKDGILSKKERNLPYGVIQNIFVKQDLFDKVFGLASLTVENASLGSGSQPGSQMKVFGMKVGSKPAVWQAFERPGSTANKVSIPGMKKSDAEALREHILQKMKENPLEDSRSGL